MFTSVIFLFNICCVISKAEQQQSTRILFGSCSRPYLPQPLWPTILSRNPDVWIWGGDIVYHDRPNIPCSDALYDYLNPFNHSVQSLHCHGIGFGAIKPYDYDYNFELQSNNNGYKQLLTNNKTKIIGIWDDHDFGENNGCYTNKWKYEAKDALMTFLDIPQNDSMRKREGIYSFHSFRFNKQLIIDIYLLDVRWFSDPKKNILLGIEQWNWLNNKMKQRSSLSNSSKPAISLFVSGIQILPFYRIFHETWTRKSKIDRVKLMEAILNYNISHPILISGDVHFGELMRYNCKFKKDNRYKSLYEITSSGLTHSVYYISLFLKNIAHYFSSDGATIGIVSDLNFGEIETIYDNDDNIKHIYLRIYGIENVLLEIDLMESRYQNIDINGKNIIKMHINDNKNIDNQDWICVGYDEPNEWISKLYSINIIIVCLVFILFGICCCCTYCNQCKKPKRKVKKS